MVHFNHDVHAIIPSHPPKRASQPGKKTMLVAVLLSFLLVMSQIFTSVHLNKPSKVSVISMHQGLKLLNEVLEPPPCLKNYLGDRKPSTKPEGTCRHLVPPKGICSLISEIFYDTPPPTCSKQSEVEFCVQVNDAIECTLPSQCSSKTLSLGVFNTKIGKIAWKRVSFANLEKEILLSMKQSDYKGFVLIQCSNAEQLFISPPLRHLDQFDKKFIDINFIMIDSLSRNHFYRSLPKTIDLLSDLSSAYSSKINVFDFPYVQSIKQRTYESLKALFSGFVDLNQEPFGTYDVPFQALPLEVFFKKLKDRQFRTLWLEDLCWSWEWGLAKDLKVMNKSMDGPELWNLFEAALQKAGIDDIDFTLASCEILKSIGKNDPFHDTPSVCFNGKFHHEYQLEYLKKYQIANKHQNLMTFTQTNVAHDETGKRIQTLDRSLEKYLRFASQLPNTLTVLFSDHGNTYGKFITKSSEAYVETFNPFLFLIVPAGVRERINPVEFQILEDNQKNLISLLDVHETLLALIDASNEQIDNHFKLKYTIPRGLLSNISPKRTCSDIPILMPSLCICQGFDVIVPTSIRHEALVHFSLGVLNNFILNQRHHSGRKGFGRCQLLIPRAIRSSKEVRLSADVVGYKFDVAVSGILSDNIEYYFFNVEVGTGDPSIRLVSYERLSMYAKFSSCQDSGVEHKLCVCEEIEKTYGISRLVDILLLPIRWIFREPSDEEPITQIRKFLQYKPSSAEIAIDNVYPKSNTCLYVLIHDYGSNFNIYVVNLCTSIHRVTMKFSLRNVLLSDDTTSKYLVRSLDVRLISSGVKANPALPSAWSHTMTVV